MLKLWWTSSDSRLDLQMTIPQARSASHQGQCDDDVLALSREPDIALQLASCEPALVRKELKGYGAWDDAELSDHAQNLQRLLWLAAGYILENPPDDWEDCGCCGGMHPPGFTGDCRDDASRL